MSEKETGKVVSKEVKEEKSTQPEVKTESEVKSVVEDNKPDSGKKSLIKFYVGAFLIVVIVLAGVLYKVEKEGRSSTNFFGALIEKQEAKAPVVIVNGEKITSAELETSVNQFTQIASAQGVDPNNTEAMAEIRTQALDVLINTELLKQEATSRGISVSDEEVEERIQEIIAELGGEEVLQERMSLVGIDEAGLRVDIHDEILVQTLLDQAFEESEISVSEEEILEIYENVGGEIADLPAIEEVRDQIENQIRVSKEQEAIDELIEQLKAEAEIERL